MAKIGLVTYYGDNFGACMQAYALQTVLQKLEGNCEIIACPEGVPGKVEPKRKSKLIMNAVKALFKGELFSRYKTRKFVLEANKNTNRRCEAFRDRYLKIKKNGYQVWEEFYNQPLDYDVYVCGSDQIWNPTFYGQCHPIYYLDFVSNDKVKIAYAPSLGIKNIEEKDQSDLRKYLSTFDAISVREINAVDILQPFCAQKVHWVLDPTLLLCEKDYEVLSFDIQLPAKPYIFCYLFGEKENTNQIKREVSKRLGLPIVSIPFVSREILSSDQKLNDVGPADFINLIKNAAFVITDSFHATAFSINFHVPFISLLRQELTERNEMSSRIYSILKQLQLDFRLVKNVEDIPERLMEMDFGTSEELLNIYREQSLCFLMEGLKTCKQ